VIFTAKSNLSMAGRKHLAKLRTAVQTQADRSENYTQFKLAKVLQGLAQK
jgi:hypothetical protein